MKTCPLASAKLPALLAAVFCFVGSALPLVAASLDEEFSAPPAAAKPRVWWHWMGHNVSKDGITKDLEAMKAAGVGGATIFHLTSSGHGKKWVKPIANSPWPENNFRSPAWWALMEHAAAEAERLGLELGMHNCPGWSASGGPWITPEKSMQQVVWTVTPVTGGTMVDVKLAQPKAMLNWYRDIGVVALPDAAVVPLEQVVDLSASVIAEGHLRWQAPVGKWLMYRFGHTSTGAHCSPVPDDLKPEEQHALECDKLSAAVSAFHFHQVLDPLQQHLGARLGTTLRHILLDSYEAGPCNWTPGFREEFKTRRGYDPLPWLPTLNKRVIGDAGRTERFAWDLKRTVSDLFVANHIRQGKTIMHALGLELHMEPYGGPFDTMDAATVPDVSMDEFWLGNGGQLYSGAPNLGAARASGQRILAAEAFTGAAGASRWTEVPAMLKADGDGAWVNGINRLVLHHWVHQPLPDHLKPGIGMGWWGTHFGRHQTWFEPGKAWLSYISRSQALLQRGEAVADVLSVGAARNATAANLCDAITAENLVDQATVSDGKIVLRSGRSYAALIITNPVLLPAAAHKIRELVENGATVIGPRLECSPSLQDFPKADAEVAAIGAALWGSGKEASRNVGKGRVFLRAEDAMGALGLGPDFKATPTLSALRWCHRRDTGTDIYFLSSRADKPINFTGSFRVKGKQPELWDSEHGTHRPARAWRFAHGRTEVDLTLEANTSVFVIFREPATTAPPAIPATPPVTTLAVAGPWSVRFPAGATWSMPTLVSWTTSDQSAVKCFSGTARYTTTLSIPAERLGSGKQLELDLGKVKELARVFVNGTDCGVAWHAPFRVEVTTALKPGVNTVEIDVTNTWANRLIGDEQETQDCVHYLVEQKAFKDRNGSYFVGRMLTAFPDWILQNKPRPSKRQTFFTWNYFTKDSPLMESGLIGPVQLLIADEPTP